MKRNRPTSYVPRATFLFCFVFFVVRGTWCLALANEVLDYQEIKAVESGAAVMVRENSKTDHPYVVIIDPKNPRRDLASLDSNKYRRPDYRMLQKGVSAKDVGYNGPYSSKKKIYILAATLAVSGVSAAVLAPVAAAGGAGGSLAGPAVAAAAGGSAMAAAAKKYQDHFKNLPDNYNRESESKIIETETDFYKFYVLKKESKPLV